jgi:hypothetical protein
MLMNNIFFGVLYVYVYNMVYSFKNLNNCKWHIEFRVTTYYHLHIGGYDCVYLPVKTLSDLCSFLNGILLSHMLIHF